MVRGTIVGDIGLAGRGWREETSTLTLGAIRSNEQLDRTFLLIARGMNSKAIQFEKLDVHPDLLQVELGPTVAGEGQVAHTRLRIRIPQGAPPADYMSVDPCRAVRLHLRRTIRRPPYSRFTYDSRLGISPRARPYITPQGKRLCFNITCTNAAGIISSAERNPIRSLDEERNGFRCKEGRTAWTEPETAWMQPKTASRCASSQRREEFLRESRFFRPSFCR